MAGRAEKYLIEKVKIKRFRSLLDTTVTFSRDSVTVICGANNIGKTNVLRALELYFNEHKGDVVYDPSIDLPKHIHDGSRGGGTTTEIIGTFRKQSDNTKTVLSTKFKLDGYPYYKLDRKDIDDETAEKFLSSIRYYFIEANNVDTPSRIAEILAEDVLLELDKQRGGNKERPLKKLDEFLEASQESISKLERKLNKKFAAYVGDDPVLKSKEVKIGFAEFEKLRDAIKGMTSVTVVDGGDVDMSSKGSGAQRAVLMSMMDFVADSARSPVIWGIDEPEAFLQPKLQKQMANKLRELAKKESHSILITTHSGHLIDLQSTEHTHLFSLEVTPKIYDRRPGLTFQELDAKPISFSNQSSKIAAIKEHLGIDSNDGWKLLPHNVLVEGEEDVKYLTLCYERLNIPVPHFIVCGGASKAKGFLQFFNSFGDELAFKPKIKCVFDEDEAGRSAKRGVERNKYKNLSVEVVTLPRYTSSASAKHDVWEVEDFVCPDLMFKALNYILRKEGYKIIDKKQREERLERAHKATQILKYAEDCARAQNPSKTPLVFDDQGRKKQICRLAVGFARKKPELVKLKKEQKDFLKAVAQRA